MATFNLLLELTASRHHNFGPSPAAHSSDQTLYPLKIYFRLILSLHLLSTFYYQEKNGSNENEEEEMVGIPP